ncbi:MAG: peroxide stress protein YaaA [Candidatus Woesearchaeota archaeon]
MVNYIICIPNSEGKASGGDENLIYRFVSNMKKNNYFLKLQPQRDLIIDEIKRILRDLSQEEIFKFFNLNGENLKDAISTMAALKDEECMSVIDRMSGVMYNSIDFDSFSEIEKQRFNDSVLIFDGLFGLLKPQDKIPNYKCKVSMRLFDSTLAKFWSKELKGYLEFVCRDKLVLDILPISHKEMIPKDEKLERIEIVFAKRLGSSYKLEGHASKELKGEFVKYIVGFELISKENLKNFKHSKGHTFSQKFSSEKEFVYIL